MRSNRPGSTLTEVLVALMIMSIGLVSLATLFPLATLRAVKASQLTHATDLRYNAEALLEMYPKMITDPDLNSQTLNLPLDFVDPNGRIGIPKNVFDSLPNVSPAPIMRNWVVDPIGWVAADEQLNFAFRDSFGHDVSGNPWTHVQRFAFERQSSRLADAFASQPDSYVTLFEGRIESLAVTPNVASGATQAVVRGTSTQNFPIGCRILFFAADGKSIQTRTLQQFDPATETLTWTEDLTGGGNQLYHGLPPNFETFNLRVEVSERRYSWLLTVRRTISGIAEVDVVVFFNRGLSVDPNDLRGDELLFEVHDAANNSQVGFQQGSSIITVVYGNGPKPAMRKGGWVFDAGNARWYRILDVQDNTPVNGIASIRIDPPAVYSSPRDNNNKLLGNFAMFPRGVVDVFPLGTKP